MRHLKILVVVLLSVFVILGCQVSDSEITTLATSTSGSTSALTTQSSIGSTSSSTTTTETLSSTFTSTTITTELNSFPIFEGTYGFASLSITNRSLEESGYYQVSTEVEFLDALIALDVSVIEITSDLDLGSIYVEAKLVEAGKNLADYDEVYRPHNHQPQLHPLLLATGIGQITLVGFDHLMIYSKYGSTIKHVSFAIDDSSDIVFRNLHLAELWEWDEINFGTYKVNDWDYFVIEKSTGIWLDHLVFEQAYDGIVDIKEESANVTLSWSRLVFEPTDFINAQIDYLEANMSEYSFYKSLRDAGIAKEDLATIASFQKKGFNFGNSTDGEGFESITVTFHHLLVKNLQDRFPRVRKGDIHLYQVILDNEELYNFRLRVSNPNLSTVNQGIVSTEGGAVLMENSIFRYVSTPIKNHQEDDPDTKYTGKYKVVNSELKTGIRTYFGSSDDSFTLWVHSGISEVQPFVWRNYEEIPYEYQLEDIYFLEDTFTEFPPGCITLAGFDWLKINIQD